MASFLDYEEKTASQDDAKAPLKRVIREILRTQVCPKTIRLLVDKIRIRKVFDGCSRGDETYRMWLTDGELLIQGLLRRELHPFITVGEIREGSLVKLTNYELAWGKGVEGREIVYFRILDLYEYGGDGRQQSDAYEYEVAAVLTVPRPRSRRGGDGEQDNAHAEHILANTSTPIVKTAHDAEVEEEEVSLVKYPEATSRENGRTAENLLEKAGTKRKREVATNPLKENNPNISSSPKKAARLGVRHTEAASKPPREPSNPFPTRGVADIPTKISMHPPTKAPAHAPARHQPITPNKGKVQSLNPRPPVTPSQSTNRPETPKLVPPAKLIPIPRPLILSSLASLTGRNASRNKPVDVLAVVSYVSSETVQRPGAPLGRNIRIRDTSTTKPVLLSVFTSPTTFLPKEGEIALFRNVTTHEFDQGSLKAWESWCGGREWHVKEEDLGKVKGFEDWETRAEGLRRLWEIIKDE